MTLLVFWRVECMGADSPSAAHDPMLEALSSRQASSEIPLEDRIYEKLIGSWRVRVFDILEDGSRQESEGEWHFARVLEGRAVQDVWIAPSRTRRTASTPRAFNRYGSTVRFYEPTSRTWRMVWINPVSGTLQTFVGRATADGIVHEGTDSDASLMRWTFRDLGEHAFHWTGERSTDGGKNWLLEAEFLATR